MTKVMTDVVLCQEETAPCGKGAEGEADGILEQVAASIDFFEALEQEIRNRVRIVLTEAINEAFRRFIGAAPYQRGGARRDQPVRSRAFDRRNGFRTRTFETR